VGQRARSAQSSCKLETEQRKPVEAFEEMYCRISALELLVLAMAQQLHIDRYARLLVPYE
jgi:hypothetical protein